MRETLALVKILAGAEMLYLMRSSFTVSRYFDYYIERKIQFLVLFLLNKCICSPLRWSCWKCHRCIQSSSWWFQVSHPCQWIDKPSFWLRNPERRALAIWHSDLLIYNRRQSHQKCPNIQPNRLPPKPLSEISWINHWIPCLRLELIVWWLIQRVKIEELDHDVVHNCKKMPTVRELHLVTIFYGEIFEIYELIVQDIYDSDFVWEGNQKVQAWRMEGQGKWLLFVYFDDLKVVFLEVVPNADSSVGWTSGY